MFSQTMKILRKYLIINKITQSYAISQKEKSDYILVSKPNPKSIIHIYFQRVTTS